MAKATRTHVFDESYAHQAKALSDKRFYYLERVVQQGQAVTPDDVPSAFAHYWSFVGEEMRSATYFTIE